MRKIIWAIVMVVGLAASASAQTEAQPGQAFAFDYETAALTTYSVVRFEQQLDGGAWTDIGIPEVANDAQTPNAHTTYRVAIPALTPGAHTANWRACNAAACGAAGATPLAFTMVIQPPAPSGGRVVSVGQ